MSALKYGDRAARDLANAVTSDFKCRAVATSIAAYAAAAGVLTASATGAIGAQDGVTLVAGDLLFIQEGLTNVTAADAGPYIVTNPGATGVAYVLARPAWWKHGALIPRPQDIDIGPEGTLFGCTTWRSFVTTALKLVGTDAPVFWPKEVSTGVTLSSGTITALTTFPIRSATKSACVITSTPTTAPHASTRCWRVNALTAGLTAASSFTIAAESAPGTTNASDVGTYTVKWSNW